MVSLVEAVPWRRAPAKVDGRGRLYLVRGSSVAPGCPELRAR